MKKALTVLMIFISGLIPLSLGATSLSLRNYSEVLVENLDIGGQYSMVELVNLPLIIVSGSEKLINIEIEALKPAQKRIKKDFEAIPDTAWIQFATKEAIIPAQGTFKSDVRINIPDDKKYLGKKYHVDILARQVAPEGTGMLLALAVKGRLLFTINKDKQGVGQPQTPINLNFAILPNTRVEMKDFPLGKKVEILAKDRKPIEIENKGKKSMKFLLQSLDPKDTVVRAEPGYETCPSTDMLKIKREEIKINGNRKKTMKLYLEIPDKPEYQGKKYHFIVSVKTGSAMAGTRYLHILVSTAGKQAGDKAE